jgi:hypothetical protein
MKLSNRMAIIEVNRRSGVDANVRILATLQIESNGLTAADLANVLNRPVFSVEARLKALARWRYVRSRRSHCGSRSIYSITPIGIEQLPPDGGCDRSA